ncbi:MAG: molybdate ABC transporter substrate-binding protein [Thiothrix sp.]|nr:molybdate ABC transporter substrate-binding protein [Thiothrix sp.]HPQ95825.1 molybdate ABC transporter substrate-binding protein [Thiolinea sp.]
MKHQRRTMLALPLAASLLSFSAVAEENLQLYAAGSLKSALGTVATAYEAAYQTPVATRFGPSGLLRKAIEDGENPAVFASANMTHPEKLAADGWGGPVVLFARNKLCALAQAEVDITPDNLLAVLLDAKIRLGTSTPKADPSGDYAWELFDKAGKIQAGSFEQLSGKALQLTGGPESASAPAGRNPYGWVMAEKKADVFLTYCTNAVLAKKEVPTLKIVQIPAALSVGADYGLLVRKNAPVEAWHLALYILSPAGQQLLREYGFEAAAIPAGE